jgi:hypothetical protein
MAVESKGTWIYLLRGPVLVTAVAVSFILPYVPTLSTKVLIHLGIALTGILWLCHDFFRFTETQARSTLRKVLDGVVLDDVLRAIHDPETGLIANVVGTFVGTSSMYALRMDAEQRTKLVQASLGTSKKQAGSILLSPGGCKALVPDAMQRWLNKGAVTESNRKPSINHVEEEEGESDSSVSELGVANEEDESASSDDPQIYVRSRSLKPPSSPVTQEDDSNRNTAQNATRQTRSEEPKNLPLDPMAVMFSILKEMAHEQIKPYMQSIPETIFETVGVSASLALAVQLGFRLRSKATFRSSASALVLSGVATGTFSTVLARHVVLGNIHDKESLRIVSIAVAMRVWERLKQTAMGKRRRWQGVLAMTVLILAGRRRGCNSSSSLHR